MRGSCPCAGPAFVRYGGNTSCAVVEIDGEAPIILDLGSGLRPLGLELDATGTPPRHLTGLLTHLHWDHLIGLPFFSTIQRPGATLDVFGPRQDECGLHELIDKVVQPPFFPVRVKELHGSIQFHEVDDCDFAVGSAKITARCIPHVGRTLGFRIDADGGSIVYISDHQPPDDRLGVADSVLELCDGADLLIHDGQYTEEEMVDKGTWGHSTPAYAVHVAAQSRVRTLVLYHHDPMHEDDDLDAMLAAARSHPEAARLEAVEAATEGLVLRAGR